MVRLLISSVLHVHVHAHMGIAEINRGAASSEIAGRKESWTGKPMSDDALDVDITSRIRTPQFDQDESPRRRWVKFDADHALFSLDEEVGMWLQCNGTRLGI